MTYPAQLDLTFDKAKWEIARAYRMVGEEEHDAECLRLAAAEYFDLGMRLMMLECLELAKQYSNSAGAAGGELTQGERGPAASPFEYD